MTTDWHNTLRDANWQRARVGDDFSYQWAEDVACIDCVCGAKEIILSESMAFVCDCGRAYRYRCYVEMTEVEQP